MAGKRIVNHCQPWLTMLLPKGIDHGWQCFCQPWLTVVPFHKPMADHGQLPWLKAWFSHGKPWVCEMAPQLTMVGKSLLNQHGWQKHCQPWLTKLLPKSIDHGWQCFCQP